MDLLSIAILYEEEKMNDEAELYIQKTSTGIFK